MILKEIGETSLISEDCEHRLEKVFSREQFLKAQEILTLKQVILYKTKELGRQIWIINRPDHKYIVYSLTYCSCMDFYLHAIIKHTKYLCKHIIAQSIYEYLHLKDQNKTSVEISEIELHNLLKETLDL